MGYLLAVDQGTTRTTAALIDDQTFEWVQHDHCDILQIYPDSLRMEHDLNDIWRSVEKTIRGVCHKAGISSSEISAIGITNQRETTCAFDREGSPLYNAIVWQDRRTLKQCKLLQEQGCGEIVHRKTGLPLDPYFSATKIKWLLNHVDSIKKKRQESKLLFGTIDTFILYKLTGQRSFKTEASNASRTLLMNIKTGEWDDELLKIFHLTPEYLPRIENSFGEFGRTCGLDFLDDDIPICGMLGDQQAALLAQTGGRKDLLKCTYGTGAFMLLNTGKEVVSSRCGLLATIAYRSRTGEDFYALEGASYIAGAVVQWLRDHLKIISSASEIEILAREANLDGMKDLLFLPFFTGIASPHWRPDAKAVILGMTRGTERSHLCRAALEGIALSINDVLKSFERDIQQKIKRCRVDGGAVVNNLLMQLQADLSLCEIHRPHIRETTVYGAAMAAGIGASLVKWNELDGLWKKDRLFTPPLERTSYLTDRLHLWDESIQKLF